MPMLLLLCCWLVGSVRLGNEILRDSGFESLVGRKIAILSNPSGVYLDSFQHIVDDMNSPKWRSKGVNVVAILAPEHGFRGDRQAETGDPPQYIDSATNLTVFSVYKARGDDLIAILQNTTADTILVDIQDVGTRLYTFAWTMYDVIVAAAVLSLRVVVLDKPNPIGGLFVEGPLLNVSCCESGYGRLPIPHRHGLTIAEMAYYFNKAFLSPKADLSLVLMQGWNRSMQWSDTGLPFVPPSPNLPSPLSCQAYPVSVFLEATTASEGRGTTYPFQVFGAPFIDPLLLATTLNSNLSPSRFRATAFDPTFFKYNGTDVEGVQYFPDGGKGFQTAVNILITFKSMMGSNFSWDGSWFGHPGSQLIDWYAGSPLLRTMIDEGASSSDIVKQFQPEVDTFTRNRQPYLLY